MPSIDARGVTGHCSPTCGFSTVNLAGVGRGSGGRRAPRSTRSRPPSHRENGSRSTLVWRSSSDWRFRARRDDRTTQREAYSNRFRHGSPRPAGDSHGKAMRSVAGQHPAARPEARCKSRTEDHHQASGFSPSGLPAGGLKRSRYERLSTLVDSAVVFDQDIPQSVGRGLGAQAIRAAAVKQITGKSRGGTRPLGIEDLARPRARRVVVTSVSLGRGRLPRARSLRDGALKFFASRPPRYDRRRFARRFKELGVREPSDYSWVSVEVVAR